MEHENRLRTWRKKGQGLVEYALILVLVAVVVIVILSVAGNSVKNVYQKVVSALGGSNAANVATVCLFPATCIKSDLTGTYNNVPVTYVQNNVVCPAPTTQQGNFTLSPSQLTQLGLSYPGWNACA